MLTHGAELRALKTRDKAELEIMLNTYFEPLNAI